MFGTTDVRDTLRHQWPAIGDDDHEYSTHGSLSRKTGLLDGSGHHIPEGEGESG